MANRPGSRLIDIVRKHESGILADWIKEQLSVLKSTDRSSESALRVDCERFLSLLRVALQTSDDPDIMTPVWDDVRGMLGDLSRSRAKAGYAPSETAVFVMSLKQPLFDRL